MAMKQTPLTLTLEDFYTGMALAGLLAAQIDEPNKEWAAEWSREMGKLMAKRAGSPTTA